MSKPGIGRNLSQLTTVQNVGGDGKSRLLSRVSAMKTRQSRLPHDTLQTALRSVFPLDAQRRAVLSALVLAMI